MSIRSALRTPAPILAIMLALLLAVTTISPAFAQNVDWMTTEQAVSLNQDFPVLVPAFVPAPFSGSPAISSVGGYYSLYWVNYGGEPTYLQITADVDEPIPAGSPADLNQELSVNASVQGFEAVNDVTSIYDNVWWIAGGVLYTVSSNNMTGTDSLTLANSLIPLQQPAQQELVPLTPTPLPAAPTTAPESQNELGTGGGNAVPAPALETDPSVGNVNVDDSGTDTPEAEATDNDGDDSEGATSPDVSVSEGGADSAGATDVDSDETEASSFLVSDTAGLVNALSGSVSLSDGTAGPPLPSRGDGTGGIRQIAIP